MLRLIFFCIVLTAISLGVNWLLDHDGMVQAEWLGYKVETTVSFIILATAFSLVMAILLLQLLIWLVKIPTRTSHKRDIAKFNKGLLSLTEGFAAIAAGDSRAVKNSAGKTRRYLGHHQPLALLLDAQAAQMQGDQIKAISSYSRLLENKTTKLIGLKGLLSEAQKTGDTKKAIQLAEETYHNSKDTENLIPLLLELYKREGEWEKAILLIEQGRGKKAYANFMGSSPNSIKREKAILYYMYAKSLFDQDRLVKALELAEKAHRFQASFLPAMTLIAQAALKLQKQRKSINIIHKAWKSNPRQQLADIYLHIYSKEPAKKQLKAAEKLAAHNPQHNESHMLVATAAMNSEDYTKARNHLKMAMSEGETVRACNLMAKIEELDEEGSLTTANEWMERATRAATDPSWVCSNCHNIAVRWNLICLQCNNMDSYVWDKPGSVSVNLSRQTQELALVE